MSKKIKIDKIPLQADEEVFALNFISKFKDLNEFTASSWNLSTTFLKSIKYPDKLKPSQKVAIFMISKSVRLLRGVSMLASNGYWPEAEIILRSLFETYCLATDILLDKSQSKAIRWLRNKEWKIKHSLKKHGSKMGRVYGNLSKYPHGSVLSVSSYVKFVPNKKFSVELGPLKRRNNFTRSARALGVAALMNVAICEISAPHFELLPRWKKKHNELMKTKYFKKTI